MCPTLCDPMDCSLSGSFIHGIFQARVLERVLQRIFPTQGSNPGLPHCRQTLYHLSHKGSPIITINEVKKGESVSVSVAPDSLRPHELQPTRLLCPWGSPGKNTGVGCHFLSLGTFLTQGSNPGLPHCEQTLYHLSHRLAYYNCESLKKL